MFESVDDILLLVLAFIIAKKGLLRMIGIEVSP